MRDGKREGAREEGNERLKPLWKVRWVRAGRRKGRGLAKDVKVNWLMLWNKGRRGLKLGCSRCIVLMVRWVGAEGREFKE